MKLEYNIHILHRLTTEGVPPTSLDGASKHQLIGGGGIHHHQSAVQLCSTISRTFLLYSRLFSLNKRAASEFAGEFGFGSQSNDCNKKKVVPMLMDDTSLLKMKNHPWSAKVLKENL